jgi:hypothetical protein
MATLAKLFSVSDGPDDCRGGNCPTVYRDEAGNFYVQGKRTKPILKSELSVAEDEDLVMIPPSLIARIKQEL